jgi:hypothetical protein
MVKSKWANGNGLMEMVKSKWANGNGYYYTICRDRSIVREKTTTNKSRGTSEWRRTRKGDEEWNCPHPSVCRVGISMSDCSRRNGGMFITL